MTDPSGPCSDESQPEEITKLRLSWETGSREGGVICLTQDIRQ